MVNHPAHYGGKVEVIKYLEDKLTPEEYIGFNIGNVIKYVSRWRNKAGLQDLKKAQWYLNDAIRYIEENKINIMTDDDWAQKLP